MAGNPQSVGLSELLDLAISSQDVGTVNFNMLRLLLDDMIKKLVKIDKEPVKLGDHDANQVTNYKNYIQGAPVSPMPGVMRYTPPGKKVPDGASNKQSTPRTPKSGKPPAPGTQVAEKYDNSAGPDSEQNKPTTKSQPSPGRGSMDNGLIKGMQDQIANLEKQLQSLNQLPNNKDLLQKSPKDKDGMSVNDMWQLIQLNNRIAAAEAGLQKMASLIEDLAKELHKVRGVTSGVKSDTENLTKSNSDLALIVAPLTDKHAHAEKKIDDLKEELGKVKSQLDLLETATGLDPKKAPTFMKKDKHGKHPKNVTKEEIETDPSLLNKLTGSEIAQIDPSVIGSFTPQQITGLSAQQLSKITPTQFAKIDLSKLASLSPSQVAKITPAQMKEMTPEQREHLEKMKKEGQHRPGPDVNKMDPHQISQLTPSQINKMTPAEIAKIRPSKIAQMTPSQLKHLENAKRGKGPDINSMLPKDISKIPISELAKLTPSQIAKISPSKLQLMTPEQRKQLEKMKQDQSKGPDLTDVSPEEISKVPTSELHKLTPSQLDKMTPEQRKEIEDRKQRSRSPSPGPSFGGMKPEEISLSEIAKMSASQAASISPSVISKMSAAQRELLEERRNSETATAADLKNMNPDDIALIPIEDLRKLTPSEIDKISPSVLALMTQEQRKRLREIKSGTFKIPNFEELSPDEIAGISLSTLDKLTPSQIENISDEVKSKMTPAQLQKLEEILIAGKNYGKTEHGEGFSDTDSTIAAPQEPETKRRQKVPKRNRGKKGQKGTGTDEPDRGGEDLLGKEDNLEVPKPVLGEHQEILTMESYLASLPKEDIENMAADAVEQELQKQYAALQGMQRQLAQDIQDKMEIIYQKLLREIIEQQLTSSPYTVIDGQEKCLGPGICKGHGMPAGIAACQYPDPNSKGKTEKPAVGAAACPSCGNEALKNLKPPRQGRADPTPESKVGADKPSDPLTDVIPDQPATKDLKSVMVLDLDKIRDDMKTADVGAFDEKDILERLGTLWEAVKVLKTNEDTLSTRLTKHETLLKKIPAKAMERMNKPSGQSPPGGENSENVNPPQSKEEIRSSSVQIVPSKTTEIEEDQDNQDQEPKEEVDKDDVQTLFNNLANVIAECADQKERIDQLVDAVRIIESGMVTKQILTDSMSDKADKGQINTKVSYDEFGNTVDELHTQLHNLMIEGYQRNENWKKVTADLAEELAEKLDKVELAPIRAFFKSRLKNLEDRMQTLSTLLEEPDPAGTRKKLLRDMNCISCDRRVNISGLTNASTLPTIGPSLPMSSMASHRALDLHRLRSQRSRFDADSREIEALEKKVNSQTSGLASERSEKLLSDKDMMQMVNRYVGSSTSGPGGPPAMRVASQAQQQMSQTQLASASMNVHASQSKRSSVGQMQIQDIDE